jgi:hypothetical protein
MSWAKLLLTGAALLALAACAPPDADLAEPPVALGDFKLGHNIVVVPDAKSLPGSRPATEDEWKTALTRAIDARFGRYDGAKFYHFGVSVDAYNLAAIDVPGVPTPKSALAFTITVWDDAAGAKLNEDAKTLTVLGIFSGAGIQPSKQTQLDNLSALAAKEIQQYLLENREWFGLPPLAEE